MATTAKYDFADKVALVTGGASGIGEACILRFAANGAKVVIADMNEAAGEQLAAALVDNGSEAIFVKTDVADAMSVQSMVDRAVERFGRLDYAVNSAGISGESNLLADFSLEGWHKTININLHGVFYSMRSEIPAMLKSGGGAIVNISSIMGLVSSPTTPAYVAAKHAVTGMTKAAGQTYGAKGVRVNAICPAYIQTPMMMDNTTQEIRDKILLRHPIGRLGTGDDIAATAMFLCSDDSSFTTGAIYPVDGGYLTT